MITILSAHGPVTIQDLGWRGHYREGVGRAGAMDRLALALGNALLGNDEGAAGIEVPLPPLHLRFETDLSFALTGAHCLAELDGEPLNPYWACHARAGQELRLGPARSGSFAYLTVHGGIDVPAVLGARSTHLRGGFGGFDGRPLTRGDRVAVAGSLAPLPRRGLGIMPLPPLEVPEAGDAIAVRVMPAGEYDLYTPEALELFWRTAWKVTPQSNRTGYRLDGPVLRMAAPTEMRSHGIVPGTIQVPAGGVPIVQLADAATMGGYPKIGAVIEADLWRMAQVRPGQSLKFLRVDYGEAVAALAELEAFVAGCRSLVDMATRSQEKLA
jgi:5-oxoprolinase (ATP-hydrolysing) subunit C